MGKKKLTKFWAMNKTNSDQADIAIDGEIVSQEWADSDTSAAGFRDDLKQLGDVKTINLHIDSPGGSVFEGIAIYNMLKQSPAKINTYVDGLAASIASVIAMSGDTIFMPKNAMLMIHNPWTFVQGNAKALRKAADDLDSVAKSSVVTYLEKAGDKLDEETLQKLLNEETWLTADEAVSYGLADEVIGANKAAASLTKSEANWFSNVPHQLIQDSKVTPISQEERDRIKTAAASSQQTTNSILGGL